MDDDDIWDELPDIDGNMHSKSIQTVNVDDEMSTMDSDTCNVSYGSDEDDISAFINDGSTDYETTSNDESDDEI